MCGVTLSRTSRVLYLWRSENHAQGQHCTVFCFLLFSSQTSPDLTVCLYRLLLFCFFVISFLLSMRHFDHKGWDELRGKKCLNISLRLSRHMERKIPTCVPKTDKFNTSCQKQQHAHYANTTMLLFWSKSPFLFMAIAYYAATASNPWLISRSHCKLTSNRVHSQW